jgi:deoxyadenosine/deoxycytidine kinase
MNYEEGNINKRQHNKLLKIYESLYFRYITLELGICENNHYFYIRESVDELLNRITQRGRESERNIKSSFLKKVECYHEKLFMREVELPYSIHDKNDITIINENEDKLSIILKKLGKLFNKYFL